GLTESALQQVNRPDVNSNLNKVYRKLLLREIVWFDGREADLAKHAFRQNGQIYITLTDLIRHIGGGIVWGPEASYILVERGGTQVRVFAGTSRVLVNGRARSLSAPAIRIDNRTFVPVRSMLALFGVSSQWNTGQGRLYVETR
ncbi:MAG: copper amine oxidase N-terminal domain-containing protein, partial [Armatimonadetes bacterium]|nr:copper amine oxidase N-terminal domain-containing protein [Armatimonadota bacterium]